MLQIALHSTAVKQTYCANCDKRIRFSSGIVYIMKFILRCGAILDLTCDELERSMAWTTKRYHLTLVVIIPS